MRINKEEVKSRFRRSMGSYDANAKIQKMVVGQLAKILSANLDYDPEHILEIGCGTGFLTTELKERFPNAVLSVNDLVEEMCNETASHNGVLSSDILSGDIEEITLPRQYDLIVSASTFQWLNDPGQVFRKLFLHLKSDGLLVFSTFGKYNLREIRLTTGGGLNYRSQEEIMELLAPYFRVEQIMEEFRLMEFSSPLDILQHLKKTGVNVSGDPSVWTKGRVESFINEYNNRFALDDKVTLTYHPLYLVCRKKTENFNG